MTRTTCLVLAVGAACSALQAQSNALPAGYDGALSNISSSRVWGRRGPAYPGGEIGLSFQNELCNPGTIPIEWRAPMQADHPMFSFMIAREVNGRFTQISDWSYCKHAFLSLNNPSTCGGNCVQPPNGGAQLGVKCSDVYSNSNNGSRFYLGPPAEINPWLGVWNPVGSYFDQGDPSVGGAAAMDGVRSLTNTQVGLFDVVKNRVTVKEADIQGGVSSGLYFQIQVLHRGERVDNRGNNIMSRPFTLGWNGSTWSTTTTGTATFGSILSRWTGSSMSIAGDGNGTFTDNDGRFAVAVKVTGPTSGMWHYEYAVHNIDNSRGGAAFRLPVCAGARVENIGFRDIDQDPLNDWTSTVAGGEIQWSAPANNSHRWNQLFNFWFDCDVAPSSGNALIDHALPGPGGLTVTVPSTVPGLQPALFLGGTACGTPNTEMEVNGVPFAGNAAFALDITTEPNVIVLLLFSGTSVTTPLGAGCDLFLDPVTMAVGGGLVSDGSGFASLPIPVPPGQTPGDIYLQAAPFLTAPPLFGLLGLSNGLKVRFASTGCN